MKRIAMIVAGVLLAGSSGIFAETTVITVGEHPSCGAWSSESRSRAIGAYQYEAWVMGYLSGWAGAERQSRDLLQNTDHAAVLEWINRYCAEHPLDNLLKATNRLIVELEAQ